MAECGKRMQLLQAARIAWDRLAKQAAEANGRLVDLAAASSATELCVSCVESARSHCVEAELALGRFKQATGRK
jgi:predicted ABC-type ATPase